MAERNRLDAVESTSQRVAEPKPACRGDLVWDWPARVCHWGFAGSSTGALVIGFCFDPESAIFQAHLLLGVVAGWFMLVRLLLAFCGCRRLRWRSGVHALGRAGAYFRAVVRGRPDEDDGLNPGTAIFSGAVYASLAGLIATGFVADWVETWHGNLAWGAGGLIAFHLAGLGLHAIRHRAWTPLAMVHGRTALATAQPERARGWGGLLLLIASAGVTWLIFHYFDAATAMLRIPFLPEIAFPLIQKG